MIYPHCLMPSVIYLNTMVKNLRDRDTLKENNDYFIRYIRIQVTVCGCFVSGYERIGEN